MSDNEDKDARQGWRARRRGSRERITRRQTPEDRALANAARAELVANLREQRELNSDGAGEDMIANMSDEDLAALYEQHYGKRPPKKMKRPAVEAAVREAQTPEQEEADDTLELEPDAEAVEGDDV
jgi:hypothetical protein